MKKSKDDLIKEAQKLADKYNEKKDVINSILNDLDEKAQEKVTNEHLSGMSLVETLMTELDQIELEQLGVIEQIKKA